MGAGHKGGPDRRLGTGHTWEERTQNMYKLVVVKGVGRKQCAEGSRSDRRLRAWARVECTSNMRCMVVTLEVSQLETSTLKFPNCRNR